eukprot:TRINITY_DN33884_c0_g1_i1.p1 TRINITY_DN33884_c0_g1~~TRINITY_DN33884_c0_g1_i1.p1  ORF type:complete len:266 (-),score=24.07 TRINITY_DN33884_c0_g1_i1:25-822(-)
MQILRKVQQFTGLSNLSLKICKYSTPQFQKQVGSPTNDLDSNQLISILLNENREQIQDLKRCYHPQKLENLLSNIRNDEIQQLNKFQIVSVLKQLLALGVVVDELNFNIINQFCNSQEEATAEQVAFALWGAGKLNIQLSHQQKDFFKLQIIENLDQFRNRQLSSILVGMANLRWKQRAILDKISENIVDQFKLANSNVQNVEDAELLNQVAPEKISFQSMMKQISSEIMDDSKSKPKYLKKDTEKSPQNLSEENKIKLKTQVQI